ncbi:TolC family protein [Nostoc sp. CHAB 5824]|nr:TolC family protein [Nostoc sp. CHAB 5824]
MLRSAILVSAFGLAGCAAQQDVRRPVTSLPAAFERTATPAALPEQALDQWWLLFDDAQLTQLVSGALEGGFEVRIAAARLDEARSVRAAALSRFRVQGDLQAGLQAQRIDTISGTEPPPGVGAGDTQSATANFNVSWELDLFGRRTASARAADADLASVRFAYEGTRAAIAAEVADALFTARGLTVQRDDAREAARLQRKLASILRQRAERGLGSDADTARVEADVAQADAVVAQLDAELQAAARALLVLTGRGVEPTVSLVLTDPLVAPPETPDLLPGRLLARRPDIREAEARLLAASARTEVQRLELFPRLTLNPGVGLSAQGGDISVTSVVWTLAAGLALPVLDRPRLLAELKAQGARAEAAVLDYEASVQRGFAEAERALVRLDADRRRVALLEAGERRARVSFDASTTLFGRGLTDLQTLLDAERTWRNARQALSGARVDALRRSVQAFRALGGGWEPDIASLQTKAAFQ